MHAREREVSDLTTSNDEEVIYAIVLNMRWNFITTKVYFSELYFVEVFMNDTNMEKSLCKHEQNLCQAFLQPLLK
ncbi:hypothetical protein IEQ34_019248 [Dendrobium chrysotoxum]|uniref:Uncharacterized protein n=1 Tax=Dendrobium chrysotoxum TaxID=161865 RepID=A0AAV7FQV3_DENCH|nr:hypothetical protein IEQ34_019248 [Dendrobium chrysotoxum]